MHNPVFLIVEDHPEVAENNRFFLQQIEPDAVFVLADNPDNALARLQIEQPDLAVIDLQFTTPTGEQVVQAALDLLLHIFEYYPALNILIYTSEYSYLHQVINAIGKHEGGFVVVSKLQRRTAFLEGAKHALNGELQLPRELRHGLELNDQEITLLELLCKESLTDKAIAARLNVSLKSVQNYVQRLKLKLNIDQEDSTEISSRVNLCMSALRRRLINIV